MLVDQKFHKSICFQFLLAWGLWLEENCLMPADDFSRKISQPSCESYVLLTRADRIKYSRHIVVPSAVAPTLQNIIVPHRNTFRGRLRYLEDVSVVVFFLLTTHILAFGEVVLNEV